MAGRYTRPAPPTKSRAPVSWRIWGTLRASCRLRSPDARSSVDPRSLRSPRAAGNRTLGQKAQGALPDARSTTSLARARLGEEGRRDLRRRPHRAPARPSGAPPARITSCTWAAARDVRRRRARDRRRRVGLRGEPRRSTAAPRPRVATRRSRWRARPARARSAPSRCAPAARRQRAVADAVADRSLQDAARGEGRAPARDPPRREGRAAREVRERGRFEALGEWKLFASSEGARRAGHRARLAPGYSVTAVDATAASSSRARTRSAADAGRLGVRRGRRTLLADARAHRRGRGREAQGPVGHAGQAAISILAPSQPVAHHPRVGRPPHRARSRARLRGELRRHLVRHRRQARQAPATAATIVTLYADKTTPGGLATCGYDDDGVPTQRWDLVKDGIFVGYQTTREQAAWIGEKASRGTRTRRTTSRSPFQRMPNVSLAPGDEGA